MARKIDGRLKPLDPGGKYHNNNLPGDVSLKTIENNRIFFFFFFHLLRSVCNSIRNQILFEEGIYVLDVT